MSVILELICKACAGANCVEHNASVIVKDQVTGLDIEVRCVCRNHGN